MKYSHIIQAVFYQPWLITPGAHASIRRLVQAHLINEVPNQREGVDICGDAVQLDSMEIDSDGIATIPVGGVMGYKLSGFEKGAGAVDVGDVMRDIALAEDDARVKAVLFDFDSPGGMVAGTPELADRIAQMEKPTLAFTDNMMCSAAYWAGASADSIWATKSADVGSIGVYMPWIDETAAFANEGLKVEIFKNSDAEYKAMGFPGTALTDTQREYLRDQVEEIASMFMGHVANNRTFINSEAMRGQTFMADRAMAHGLVDGIVSDREEARRMLIG